MKKCNLTLWEVSYDINYIDRRFLLENYPGRYICRSFDLKDDQNEIWLLERCQITKKFSSRFQIATEKLPGLPSKKLLYWQYLFWHNLMVVFLYWHLIKDFLCKKKIFHLTTKFLGWRRWSNIWRRYYWWWWTIPTRCWRRTRRTGWRRRWRRNH